jgi:hypothetical protein
MLDELIQSVMAEIPNCVAFGIVDLSSGTLLAIQAAQDKPQEMLNLVTAAIAELFDAPLMQAFAQIYAGDDRQAASSDAQFTELLLLNNHHNYLLLRGRQRPNIAVIVITDKATPSGLLMMRGLKAMPEIENAV